MGGLVIGETLRHSVPRYLIQVPRQYTYSPPLSLPLPLPLPLVLLYCPPRHLLLLQPFRTEHLPLPTKPAAMSVKTRDEVIKMFEEARKEEVRVARLLCSHDRCAVSHFAAA